MFVSPTKREIRPSRVVLSRGDGKEMYKKVRSRCRLRRRWLSNNWQCGVVVSWSTPEKDNTCACHRGLWNGSVDVHVVWTIVGWYMWQWNSSLAFAVDFLLSMFLFLQLSCSCFAIDNTSTRDRSYATFWTLSMGSISSVLLGLSTVPNPDLEISGGPRSSRPLDKTGEGSPKRMFSALRASVWSKNKDRSPGPSPRSATVSGSSPSGEERGVISRITAGYRAYAIRGRPCFLLSFSNSIKSSYYFISSAQSQNNLVLCMVNCQN